MTRILTVDTHPVVLEGLSAVFDNLKDLEIAGRALNGLEAMEAVRSLNPQIVIMEILLPDIDGIELIRIIKGNNPKVKIIIHTMSPFREILLPLMTAGISGFISKQKPVSDLLLAVQVVKSGGTYLSEDAFTFWEAHRYGNRRGKNSRDRFDLLSPREREVFQLLAEGKASREVAARLGIGTKTVEAHKYRIMNKLQLRSLMEWTKEAIRRGLIRLDQ